MSSNLIRIIFSLLLLQLSGFLYGQKTKSSSARAYVEIRNLTEELYVNDPLIINGVFFEDAYLNANGHQFMRSRELSKGYAIFRNKRFEDIDLKYDVFHQQLIMGNVVNNTMQMIILTNEFVSEFGLHNKKFKRLAFNDEEASFYQLVSEADSISCYYVWYKSRSESHSGSYMIYNFSELKYRSYLYIGNELLRFKNNRTFIRLFPEQYADDVSAFLKEKGYSVKNLNDDEMALLVSACQTILERR